MLEAPEIANPCPMPAEAGVEPVETDAVRQRLTVVTPASPRPPQKDLARVGAHLTSVVGQFVEIQQQVAEQVVALEDSVRQQRADLALAAAQLPELKERVNWLIASHYEQSKNDESVRERLNRQETGLCTIAEAVRWLCEGQAQWKSTLDGLIEVLVRAKSVPLPNPPSLTAIHALTIVAGAAPDVQ